MSQILYYKGEQVIDVTLTGDYENDRKIIFGEGGFIKDKPLVKAVMCICGYKKVKAYITNDILQGEPIPIYNGINSRFMLIEVLSALMARVTNYFQAIQGVRDENPDDIKNDINNIINELIIGLKKPEYDVSFTINFFDSPLKYEVIVEVYKL